MIKNIGKLAEYLVLTELLKKNIEAYPAISFQQDNYDITVVLQGNLVIRLEVKATELQNDSTNNRIGGLVNKNFDFLVLVVIDQEQHHFFILTKEEVKKEIASTANQLYVSVKDGDGKDYIVKSNIVAYKNKWDKITTMTSAIAVPTHL